MQEDILVLSILLIFFLILIIIFSFFIKYLGNYKRKYNFITLRETLRKHKDKIVDENDLIYLTLSLDKLENYYKKWWLNLTPNYAYKQWKINKILKKYNINVWDE